MRQVLPQRSLNGRDRVHNQIQLVHVNRRVVHRSAEVKIRQRARQIQQAHQKLHRCQVQKLREEDQRQRGQAADLLKDPELNAVDPLI